LKRGWRIGDGVRPTFFGAGGGLLRRLAREDDHLALMNEEGHASFVHTSGGVGRIVPNDYDAFLVVGGGLGSSD
jgi:hypothetical protein